MTEFLRDGWGDGETLINLVRDAFFQDAYRETAELEAAGGCAFDATGPLPALVDPGLEHATVVPPHLGLDVGVPLRDGLCLGRWYPVQNQPGIYVSVIRPDAIAREILESDLSGANRLDPVEARALDDVVAFDLDRFELGFANGTEHPRVEWSAGALDAMKDPVLPGPDGIGAIAPLVSTGVVNPRDAQRTVATFTGGFKQAHAAFRYGSWPGTTGAAITGSSRTASSAGFSRDSPPSSFWVTARFT